MSSISKVTPTPEYRYRCEHNKITPRRDYKYKSLHTKHMPKGGAVTSVDAEWCPVCLSRSVSEKVVDGKPIWYCLECGNEW